jgi:hypothetical protein
MTSMKLELHIYAREVTQDPRLPHSRPKIFYQRPRYAPLPVTIFTFQRLVS